MLVDCGSCVVHVFSAEARSRYALEQLWAPGQTLDRYNHALGSPLTIDTITTGGVPQNSDGVDGVDSAGATYEDETAVDMDGMGSLSEYEDEYLDKGAWSSMTEYQEAGPHTSCDATSSTAYIM